MDIFVGSLPFKLKESELREIFEKCGEVTAVKIVIDRRTGQSKGFGFVEMPDEKQALEAIRQLNGAELKGRNIVVSKSEENTDKLRKTSESKSEKENKPVQKNFRSMRGRKSPGKKKENVIGRYDDEEQKEKARKKALNRLIKGAKTFKVGKRKKR